MLREAKTLKVAPRKADINIAGVSFLRTEIETGLTFARIALRYIKTSPGKSDRNRRNARKGYETAMRQKNQVVLTPTEADEIDRNLQSLQQQLKELGEQV